MKGLSVMMYHALYDGTDELDAIEAEDRPYAVSVSEFKRHLDFLQQERVEVISLADVEHIHDNYHNRVMLTFDDGHKSFYHHAFPILADRGLTACFFVTSDLVEQREDFCDWHELREMHYHGMAIQSHGKTHHFLNDMPVERQYQELERSKSIIEEKTDNRVYAISFPGGRYDANTIKLGRRAEYTQFYTSEFGLNRPPFGSGGNGPSIMRRMPLRQNTTFEQFTRFALGDTLTMFRNRAITQTKTTLKKVLGNRLYHELYKRYSR